MPIFAQAIDDGTAPEIEVTAVASVERVDGDRVRVSYYRAPGNQQDGQAGNRIVLHQIWQAQAWLGMRSTFERARDAIEAQRAGEEDDNSARAASRREAVELIRRIAGADLQGENVKTRIARTAEQLGWDLSRTEDVWRGEARRIEAHEMDQLRALTQP